MFNDRKNEIKLIPLDWMYYDMVPFSIWTRYSAIENSTIDFDDGVDGSEDNDILQAFVTDAIEPCILIVLVLVIVLVLTVIVLVLVLVLVLVVLV